MKMQSVESGNLARVGYDSANKLLYIDFHNGSYVYFDVPDSVYDALINAFDIGKFFASNICGKYEYQRRG